MRLTDHLERIDEKVKKNEIEAALKNSHILVGAEFEFLHNELKGKLADYEVAWEAALDDYDDYDEEYKKWRQWSSEVIDKRVKLEGEIENYMEDQKSAMFKELDRELRKVEKEEENIDDNATAMGEDYYNYFKLLGSPQKPQQGFPKTDTFAAPIRPGDDDFLFKQWKDIVTKLD